MYRGFSPREQSVLGPTSQAQRRPARCRPRSSGSRTQIQPPPAPKAQRLPTFPELVLSSCNQERHMTAYRLPSLKSYETADRKQTHENTSAIERRKKLVGTGELK